MKTVTFLDGIETCAAAGTAIQFESSNRFVREITITANSANTGIVVIGTSSVVAAASTRRGHPLNPDESMTIKGFSFIDHGQKGDDAFYGVNLKDLWIDAVTSGEEVSWIALQ